MSFLLLNTLASERTSIFRQGSGQIIIFPLKYLFLFVIITIINYVCIYQN